MRTLLLLPFLLTIVSPGQDKGGADEGSLVVLGFKCSKTRQAVEKQEAAAPAPAAALTRADRNYERGRRANDPAGVRYPDSDTYDERRAALEKNVQKARTPERKPVEGFAYKLKARNTSTKAIEIVFWEYQFTESANPANVARRQFLCGVNIKPNKEAEMHAFSPSGPSGVISAGSLANKSGNLFDEKATINRVEYADGSIWQRKDWNFAEVREAIARAVATPWGAEMCRSL